MSGVILSLESELLLDLWRGMVGADISLTDLRRSWRRNEWDVFIEQYLTVKPYPGILVGLCEREVDIWDQNSAHSGV
jgi:hypothetical protein